MPNVIASVFNLSGPGKYIHWHWIQISVANLVVIGAMILVFVLAVVLPFPHGRRSAPPVTGAPEPSAATADEEAAR